MPIYEYRCRKCKRKFEKITFRVSEDVSVELQPLRQHRG